MKKNIIIPTVALFVICLVCTLLLAFANNVTDPIIKQLAVNTEKESRLKVLEIASDFKTETNKGINYAVGVDKDGNTVGYVFVTTTKSYGGDLQVMTGVDSEGKVTGIEILQISDTAGLGMNAKKEDFRNGFKGLTNGIIVAKNNADHDKNEVLALTGATITSKAVSTAVNEALSNYETITGNGGAN